MVMQLLVLYVNGNRKVIKHVSDYGFNKDGGIFWFVKNGRKSFFNPEVITFFGSEFDFYDGDVDENMKRPPESL
jgi:hypothetical protein